MALDAEVKGVSANSYLTVNEADDILTNQRLNADVWSAASTADKEKALIWATRLLDQAFDWDGAKRTLEQALRWPRGGMLDQDKLFVDQETLPTRLKTATADLAFELIARDRVSDPALTGLGFRSASVSGLNVTVDPQMTLGIIPQYVIMALEIWGTVKSAASGGMTVAKLLRA